MHNDIFGETEFPCQFEHCEPIPENTEECNEVLNQMFEYWSTFPTKNLPE